MRTEEKLYTVYRLKNVVTGKNYIGMTSQNPRKRWFGEYTGKMNEAIQEFPLDLCWKKHIEFQTTDKNQALELESELMKWYDSVENGYNVSEYGNSHFRRSEETRRKMSEALTGEKHPFYGKHLSEEHKNKISKSMGINGILQYSKDGIFIAEYPSVWEAERNTGCYHQNISKCCKGKLKSCGGYVWRYKEG